MGGRDQSEPQSPEQQDEIWQRTAKKFSPFAEEIMALREALKNANAYPPEIIKTMSLRFSDVVEGEATRDLLAAILLARIARENIVPADDVVVEKEVEAMKRELGVERGERRVALEGVIRGVLLKLLRLPQQTQTT